RNEVSGLTVDEIEELYGRYGESVLHRCRQFVRSEAEAWDAMHQTFVRAIKYRTSYRAECHPRTWLFTIATRVCMDELRTKKKHAHGSIEDANEPHDDGAVPRTLEAQLSHQKTVTRLLSLFSTKIQEIVVMRYFDEMEVKEISAQTGLSERTVARRLSQFMDRSRRILEEQSA
ncbi:MAG: sigma-70 family RNA polymerase sigma factor, partial [Deltaproteobacteria bacterium]